MSLNLLTLSLLGYLKTRIRWGGVNLTPPPPLNPMFDVQIWQMIHHWKALVSTFRICKKKIFAKSSYIVKMFAKKKLSKKIIYYTFLKSPWLCHFKYAKNVQSVFLCHMAFQKAKSYQNLTTESGSKQRFS